MQLISDHGRTVAVLRPATQLVDGSVADLRREVGALLLGGHDVVFDLAGVPFADSAGLALLVALEKSAVERGRRFLLCGLRSNMKALLDLTRLDRVFEFHEDVRRCLDALGAGSAA